MKLHSKMTKEEVYKALEDQVAATWGAERLKSNREIIGVAARNIWAVISQPLTPFSEEPEFHLTHTGLESSHDIA